MNELVVSTITEVIKSSREIYQDFYLNHFVSKYRKQELRNALDAYIIIRKSHNQEKILIVI